MAHRMKSLPEFGPPVPDEYRESERFRLCAIHPDEVVSRRELHEAVVLALATLPARQANAVCLRFGIGCEDHTFAEIGDLFEVSHCRAVQLVNAGLRKLRDRVQKTRYSWSNQQHKGCFSALRELAEG